MSDAITKESQALFLAIDQGGHASRVMVFDVQGNVVAQAKNEVSVSHPQQDWVEQDGDEIVYSIQDPVKEIAEILGDKCRAIVAAGLATQRSNVVCWNKQTGHVLSPVISWQDRRAAKWMKQFDLHAQRIRQISGLLPTAHYGVSKLVWCLENLPGVQSASSSNVLAWGPLSSFLLFRLLDEKPVLVDPANASRTLLWDINNRAWSTELLNLFRISGDSLPESVPSRYNFGSLDVGGCKIPLMVCTGDQSAALFAFGQPERGIVSINIGTGAFLQTIIPEDVSETKSKLPDRLLKSIVWSDVTLSMLVLEATVNGAGSAIKLFENEAGLSAAKVQNSLPDWLDTVEHVPLFLNGVSGLGAPYWVPDYASKFVGDGEPAEKVVAIIESIIFLLQVNMEEIQKKGVKLNQIVVSGGLSVLDGLCQRLADLSRLQVHRQQQCEATAKGLAFLVADQDRLWQSGKCTIFNPASNEKLAQRFQRWRIALEASLN